VARRLKERNISATRASPAAKLAEGESVSETELIDATYWSDLWAKSTIGRFWLSLSPSL
jgi:hypothetical protein